MKDYSYVRGFNYIPSYACNIYEIWRSFDADVFDRELGLGKKFFPKMNAVRFWLSYDAFRYDEDRQAEYFETALSICEKYGLKVIPCLFNCWHGNILDAGGMYHPWMIPKSIDSATESMFDSYFKKIVAAHKDDQRILLWDICNEPFSYDSNKEYTDFMRPYELAWLRKMCIKCHESGATQPCGVSFATTEDERSRHEAIADVVDVFLVHPYYYRKDEHLITLPEDGFDQLLQKHIKLSQDYNKPVLTTETCWGSRNSLTRAQMIKKTLEAHKRHNLGFIAHALYWSPFADLHDEEDGPVGKPGNLMFITKDGKIREGHEVFNEF